MLWIVNASPLILLGKIGRLQILKQVAPSYIIPEAVWAEVLAGPEQDPARSWLEEQEQDEHLARGRFEVPEILAWDLGAGETAVLSVALRTPNAVSVIDDLAARSCAQAFGLPIIGTLGVLIKAKAQGLIPTLRPELDKLVLSGSLLSEEFRAKALCIAGEH